YLALFWGAGAALAILAWRPGPSRVVALAGALAAAEWLRGHLFTGFPWNAPGYAASAFDGLAQLAAHVGAPGLTLLVLLWAGAVIALLEALLDHRRSKGRLAFALALVL